MVRAVEMAALLKCRAIFVMTAMVATQ